ncbi:MAG: hypothetical protein F6K47_36200 [Symploca sp. SIO2E6]|nr:hypothetical protein [Symploca sp. SIO2E6]
MHSLFTCHQLLQPVTLILGKAIALLIRDRLRISVGRVRTLLTQGRIEGARKLGRRWQIPTRTGV